MGPGCLRPFRFGAICALVWLAMVPGCGSEVGPSDTWSADPDVAGQAPPPLCRVELACDGVIPDEPKRACGLRIEDGYGGLVYDGQVGIERRGRSSQQYPKPNYSLELRDVTGAEQPTGLLGMGRESDWILDGMWADRSLIRNELAFAMFRSLGPGRWAPRGRFCELWLNDAPRGIYRLGERIKRDDDRIDLPADDGSGQAFIVKQDDEGGLQLAIGEQHRWKLVYPHRDRATAAQRAGVQAFLDALDDALRAAERDGEGSTLLSLLDLDAVVDFVIVQELAKSVDAYNLSLHLWKAPGAPAQAVPWDFDLSMGQPIADNRPGHDQPSQWVDHRTLFIDALAQVPTFRARLAERYRAHRAGPLAEAAIDARLDYALATLDGAAVAENFRIWPLDEVDFRFIFPPYGFYSVASHDEEIGRVRTWLHARLAWMDAHIDQYPD